MDWKNSLSSSESGRRSHAEAVASVMKALVLAAKMRSEPPVASTVAFACKGSRPAGLHLERADPDHRAVLRVAE